MIFTLRQWTYPSEFRISESGVLSDVDDALSQTIDLIQRLISLDPPGPGDTGKQYVTAIALAASGLWNCRRNLGDSQNQAPSKEIRKSYRHVVSALDKLEGIGLKVIDHKGEPYTPGLGIEVLVFQPEPGLDREMITETVEPSVFLGNQRIQTGKVIVGKPSKQQE